MLIAMTVCLPDNMSFADTDPVISPQQIKKEVIAEGACAIVGMSAEQCQSIALQRARATAIEQAAGVHVVSSTIVTDARLAADFIKTYARGLIIKEKVIWLPLGQYQQNSSMAPIPEYRVRIIADVYIPKPKIKPLGLKSKLNAEIFRNNEKARLEITTSRPAHIAIFNITATGDVVMLLPNNHGSFNIAEPGVSFIFPSTQSPVELIMQTLPGHIRDAEAFLIIAVDKSFAGKFNALFSETMNINEFFKQYSHIVDYAEDTVIAYEIVAK